MAESTFSLEIASDIFGESVSAERARLEGVDVQRFRHWINKPEVNKATIHANCLEIDRRLVSKLSGPNMLEVARMIEARCPDVIENMPTLKRNLELLKPAHVLAQVFMPASMAMLIRALEEEGSR
jgi:hypothetical protein